MRTYLILCCIMVVSLNACKTSNDVVSNGLIQKRKHRPGFHIGKLPSKKQVIGGVKPAAFAPGVQDEEIIEHDAPTAPDQQLYAAHRSSDQTRERSKQRVSRFREPLSKLKKPSSFAQTAVRRTKQLQELNVLDEANKEALIASSSITGVSALVILLTLYLTTTTIFIPYLLVGAFYVALAAIPFSGLITLLLILERLQLKKGKTSFSERFIRSMERTSKVMRILSLITVMLFAASFTMFILALIFPIVGLELSLMVVIAAASLNALLAIIGGAIALPLTSRSSMIQENFNTMVMTLSFIIYALIFFFIAYFFYWLHNL